jgi:uncharacterized alpha-E superfamily protein
MISRVAESCFWFGRYLERAESTARLLQVTGALALDAELSSAQYWLPMIITTGEQKAFLEKRGDQAASDGEEVQRYLALEPGCAVSLLRSVGAARENARSIREVISLEAWESLNELYLWISSPQASEEFAEHRYGFYRTVRREAQLCQGLLRNTMLHDAALAFIWLGTLLERLSQTARILDVHGHAFANAAVRPQGDLQVVETGLWLSLLRACYGFEPFLKLHHGPVTGEAVASFLIFESRFPRSVRHCLQSVESRMRVVRPPERTDLPALRAQARLLALDGWLADKSQRPLDIREVHDLLTHVVDQTHYACDEINEDLFGLKPAATAAA